MFTLERTWYETVIVNWLVSLQLYSMNLFDHTPKIGEQRHEHALQSI